MQGILMSRYRDETRGISSRTKYQDVLFYCPEIDFSIHIYIYIHI